MSSGRGDKEDANKGRERCENGGGRGKNEAFLDEAKEYEKVMYVDGGKDKLKKDEIIVD
jgi:hypothetical protein